MFEYDDEVGVSTPRLRVAEIPSGLTDEQALFEVYYEQLDFPGWFGFNWDALSDLLRSLSWLEPCTVVVRHRDLPQLPADDLRIYLDVLDYCVENWSPNEPYALRVRFPERFRERVLRVMGPSS